MSGVTLYMDDWQGYSVVKKVYKYHVVDHGHGIYAVGGAYTNTIEAFGGRRRQLNAELEENPVDFDEVMDEILPSRHRGL